VYSFIRDNMQQVESRSFGFSFTFASLKLAASSMLGGRGSSRVRSL
jgi:hypothetical protein